MKNKLKLTRFVVAKLNNVHLVYGGGNGEDNQDALDTRTCGSRPEDTCVTQTSDPKTTEDPKVTALDRNGK